MPAQKTARPVFRQARRGADARGLDFVREIEKRLRHRFKRAAMDGAGSKFMKFDQVQIRPVTFVLAETIFRETRAEFAH